MRPDMKTVVTEKPRAGGRIKTPKGSKRAEAQYPLDEYPRREAIRRKWEQNGEAKHFTDVIGPLYRYLLKQCGRPWDKVYSEIAQHLPKTSVQNRHIYTHVFQFVEFDVEMIDGKPYHQRTRRYNEEPIPIRSRGKYIAMYVNPENGLLYRLRREPKRKTYEQDEPGVKVYPGVQYHKIKGVWYEVKVRRYPMNSDVFVRPGILSGWQFGIQDTVLGRWYGDMAALHRIYGGGYIAASKRQLTKREIKFANLD